MSDSNANVREIQKATERNEHLSAIRDACERVLFPQHNTRATQAILAHATAMAARISLLENLYRAVEENGMHNDMIDDVWVAIDALIVDDMRRRKEATP